MSKDYERTIKIPHMVKSEITNGIYQALSAVIKFHKDELEKFDINYKPDGIDWSFDLPMTPQDRDYGNGCDYFYRLSQLAKYANDLIKLDEYIEANLNEQSKSFPEPEGYRDNK